MNDGQVPLMLRGRGQLGTIVNQTSAVLNAARAAKARGRATGAVAALPRNLEKLKVELDELTEALDDPDVLPFAIASTRRSVQTIIAALPEAEARAKQQTRIVISLDPAIKSLAQGAELMMELNKSYEGRHMAMMAAAISRAKPRAYAGDPMLARSVVKRAAPAAQRVSTGKRRGGGGRRGKGRGGK